MRFHASLVLVTALASVAPAQGASAPTRAPDPIPGNSRADEVWAPAPQGSDALRSLKHISLTRTDRAWLTLGGSVRLRGIDTRDFGFSAAPAMQDDYTEWRTLLSADLWAGTRAGWHARGFAEFRDAQGFGRTLPGGVRPAEADRSDWQSHFAEVGFGKSGVRVGRQDIALGRERLLGYADWANSRRSFEGVRAIASLGRYTVDAFDGRVMLVRIDARDRPDSTTRTRYVAVGRGAVNALGAQWRLAGGQLYALDVAQRAGGPQRLTTGARLWWDRRAARTDWVAEFEGATQTGRARSRDVRAWFGVAEGTVTWRDVRFAPSAIAAFEVGSGSGADSATRAGEFAPPYATAHAHNGFADVFGRGNMLETRVGAGARPHRGVQLQLLLRRFSRVSLADGAWTKSNTVLRAAGGSSARHLGNELDLNAQWIPTPRVRIQGGASWVNAGDFIKDTGNAAPIRWAFLSTAFVF